MKTKLLLLVWFFTSNVWAQPSDPDACGLRQYCTPCNPRQCTANVDSRRCDVFLNTPFGQINRTPDPACESARASQNMLYDLQRSDCERARLHEITQCKESACARIAETCNTIKAARSRPVKEFKVLWVDDHPDNNKQEIRALEQLGAKLTAARSTESAMTNFRTVVFDLVISDFARAGDRQAGYTLLHQMRRSTGPQPPYIIYSKETSQAMVAEAKGKGAFDQTNDPVRLLNAVEQALGR